MPAPTEIHALLQRFEQNREAYTSGDYNETQLRREFLDPFFVALGWDIENKQGYAEAYKDVVHEDAIKIGTATKAPDYSFRIGGARKFFVEAKKPSVNLKEDISPAYQVRRYAWSAKLPLSILTDFEEFAVYDCRIKPLPDDKSSVGRVLYFKHSQYLEQWDEIASIFSREAVLRGSFDKYVESSKGKKGTAEVDDAFLKEIESWRESLARNIALRNAKLSVRDLNFAVQRIIDRIIFLRICEDRGIEIYGSLLALTNGTRIYKRLCDLFYRADEKYNSGLFHFQKEKHRPEPPDEFTPHLDVDDKPLYEIIKNLYYPDSSYEFSVLPADILGQVYEQFLGKVIRLTAGHQAKIEDKPEVKKAGGVYYTPTYIVDYIVKNTVGKLLGYGGQGIGYGGQGMGDGVQNNGGSDGAQIVSGTGSMEEGDGTRGGSAQGFEDSSAGGAIRTDQPDATGGGINPGEHSGGVRTGSSQGVPPSSLDSKGLADGTGDSSGTRSAASLSDNQPGGTGNVSFSGGGENANPSDSVAPTLTPTPETLTPKPQTLTPKQASKLRILDPACGSGSFLIGAYQYLLDWHRDWYVDDGAEKWATGKNPALYQAQVPKVRKTPSGDSLTEGKAGVGGGDGSTLLTGTWRLTTAERKRILLNNIYGVDIDPQAVEVTKLSLLLKVLEGENEQTLARQLKMFHERALPDLSSNIKCGNSLIGPDFYDGEQLSLMDDEERMKINAFDWKAEFPEIFRKKPLPLQGGVSRRDEGVKQGGPSTSSGQGFDAVIGNPP